MLNWLYRTVPGRMVLKVLTRPGISKVCGRALETRASAALIPLFIRKNHIDMQEFSGAPYRCFNDFFCRPVREGARVVEQSDEVMIAPCDGLLSAYPIEEGLVIPVKSSRYSIADLLRDEELAARFDGGSCLVYRLCVNHYHRYAYVESGVKSDNRKINGVLHTVRPIALRELPVFTENAREYTVIHTEHFGDVVQMEVGAMLVGKICNLHGEGKVSRGQEKGYFLYGGSTVIVLTEKGQVHFPEKLFAATREGREVPVKLGQRIGMKCKSA